MDAKITIPISEARRRIFALAREVQKPGTVYTLTDKGSPKAVMVSAQEFEALIETLEAYRQFPHLDRDSKQAWDDLKQGKIVSLDKVMADLGYVARRHTKKGSKRTRTPR